MLYILADIEILSNIPNGSICAFFNCDSPKVSYARCVFMTVFSWKWTNLMQLNAEAESCSLTCFYCITALRKPGDDNLKCL